MNLRTNQLIEPLIEIAVPALAAGVVYFLLPRVFIEVAGVSVIGYATLFLLRKYGPYKTKDSHPEEVSLDIWKDKG